MYDVESSQHVDAKGNIMVSPLAMKKLKGIVASNLSRAMQLLSVGAGIQIQVCTNVLY